MDKNESDEEEEPYLGYMFDAAAASQVHEFVVGSSVVKYLSSCEEVGETAVQGGHAVWRGAQLLSACISQFIVKGDAVLELGCGVGLVGLICAALGAKKVWLTDRDQGALALCQQSIAVNEGFADICQVNRLLFGQVWTDEKVNLVVAADIIYSTGMISLICKTASSSLKNGGIFILAASFDLGPDFANELEAACSTTGLQAPVLVNYGSHEQNFKVWSMTYAKQMHSLEQGLLEQVCTIKSKSFHLWPRAFLPAWNGTITLAFQGWPQQVLDLKQTIEEALPGLPAENPGSKWPKLTLGASILKLTLPELEILDSILRHEFSPQLLNKAELCWYIDSLWLTVYASGSHEIIFSKKRLPMCSYQMNNSDDSIVPASEIARVKSIIDESSMDLAAYLNAFNGTKTQWEAGETNADRYIQPGKPGVSLVTFLHSPPLLEIIRRLRYRTDCALPGTFRWFHDEALHCSIRALIMS